MKAAHRREGGAFLFASSSPTEREDATEDKQAI